MSLYNVGPEWRKEGFSQMSWFVLMSPVCLRVVNWSEGFILSQSSGCFLYGPHSAHEIYCITSVCMIHLQFPIILSTLTPINPLNKCSNPQFKQAVTGRSCECHLLPCPRFADQISDFHLRYSNTQDVLSNLKIQFWSCCNKQSLFGEQSNSIISSVALSKKHRPKNRAVIFTKLSQIIQRAALDSHLLSAKQMIEIIPLPAITFHLGNSCKLK